MKKFKKIVDKTKILTYNNQRILINLNNQRNLIIFRRGGEKIGEKRKKQNLL